MYLWRTHVRALSAVQLLQLLQWRLRCDFRLELLRALVSACASQPSCHYFVAVVPTGEAHA